MEEHTKFLIENVQPANKYKGAYKRIFAILERDRIFTEAYETDTSKGLIGTTYHLEVGEYVGEPELSEILSIKNVTLDTADEE